MLKALNIILIIMEVTTNFKTYTQNDFTFSPFQNKACEAILKDKHVLVTAHTGSGKTLPALFAIYYWVSVQKKRVIYTSPIKALSNQKYKEMKDKFPEYEVGILTGDIKHNPEAQVLIMTTEILQNHCYKQKNKGNYLDFQMNLHEDLGCVIFDEVHYIDDIDRGTIWEQTMMMLPNSTPYVMLSATIGQKEIFAQWVETMTHKEVVICHHNERVVPLTFYEYFTIPTKYIQNLTDRTKKTLFVQKTATPLRVIKTPDSYHYSVLNQTKKCIHELHKDRYFVPQKYVLNECLRELRDQDMFPALVFVFSRKQVEHLATQITTPLYLDGEKEAYIEPMVRQTMVRTFTNWREYIELPEYRFYVDLLEKGIGIHHAGMLPVFREIMEILYEKKYIKCLIATETFAIGLNMPTRTTVFYSLYKHDGKEMRLLQSHEFTQMAGRAGRRNLDKVGHVVLMTNLYEPPTEHEYKTLFHGTPKVLKSKFRITYHLLLNYLHDYSEDDFVEMVQTSMMNTDISAQIQKCSRQIEHFQNEYTQCKSILDAMDFDAVSFFTNYEQLKQQKERAKNKEKKKLSHILRTMEDQDGYKLKQKHIYDTMMTHQVNMIQEQKDKAYAENYIRDQIQGLYSILKENAYMDSTNQPTQKGQNVCYIHEIPCLVFGDFYEQFDKLKHMTEVELLCLLSCFYDLKVKEDYKVHSPPFLKKELAFLRDSLNSYTDKELLCSVYVTCQYHMQYDLMDYMKQWYESVEDSSQSVSFFEDIKKEKDIFIGDFMKCCMKIVNMCNELCIFGENDGNFGFVEKVQGVQKKIQKNIVTNQSFYL